MAEAKTIYCPRCHRAVCHYDGKQSNNPMAKCKKCRRLIVYDIKKNEVNMKNVPKRDQASGMRYY